MLPENLLAVQGIRCFSESRLFKTVIKQSAFRFFIDTIPSNLTSLISISVIFQTTSRYARRSLILKCFLNLNFSKKIFMHISLRQCVLRFQLLQPIFMRMRFYKSLFRAILYFLLLQIIKYENRCKTSFKKVLIFVC